MMRQIEYKFNDKTYYLSFTAEALFTVYDKFGYTSDILTTTGCLESTAEGWKNCCYLAALMASQGELQRRRMGYRPADMLEMETLRTGLRPAEVPELRMAVRQALEEGFRRENTPEEPEEVNLVLAAREESEKKKTAQALQGFISSLERLVSLATARKPPSSSPQGPTST